MTTPQLIQRVCHRLGCAAQGAVENDEGFTLIEALVSFVLLAVVAGASITASVAALRSDNTTHDRVTAANLAQQDLENARSLQYPNYPAGVAAHLVTVGTKKFSVQRTVSTNVTGYTTCPSLWTPGLPTSLLVTTTVTLPGTANTVKVATVVAC